MPSMPIISRLIAHSLSAVHRDLLHTIIMGSAACCSCMILALNTSLIVDFKDTYGVVDSEFHVKDCCDDHWQDSNLQSIDCKLWYEDGDKAQHRKSIIDEQNSLREWVLSAVGFLCWRIPHPPHLELNRPGVQMDSALCSYGNAEYPTWPKAIRYDVWWNLES